jgi:hypothetical protein
MKYYFGMVFKIFCCAFIVSSAYAAHAAHVPAFLFIPVENAGRNPDYEYIGKSATKELNRLIGKNFAVREISERTWRALARENQFIYEDEYHTRSVALQLGLILKRDLVLSGSYLIEPSKDGGTDTVFFNVYLQRIKDRKMISHIKFRTPADASIFTRMNEFSSMVIAELSRVLPDKNEAEKKFYDEELQFYKNQFFVSGGTTFAISPAPVKEISETGDVDFNPGDFEHKPLIAVQYRRLNFLFDGFQFHLGSGFSFGSTDINMVSSANRIKVDYYSFSLNAGPGYRFNISSRAYLALQAGGGFYYGKSVLDLGMSGKEVINKNTGENIDEIKIDYYAPTAQGDLIIGYHFTGNLAFEVGSAYRVYFGSEENSKQALAYGGFVFGF